MVESQMSPNMSPFAQEHLRRYLESNGSDGHMWKMDGVDHPVPTLILMARGRNTGIAYKTPLIYGRDGDDFILVASKRGAPVDPGWYLNLKVYPEAVLQVAAERIAVRARIASSEERARIWPRMVEIYPPYVSYLEKSGRVIPVLILSRI